MLLWCLLYSWNHMALSLVSCRRQQHHVFMHDKRDRHGKHAYGGHQQWSSHRHDEPQSASAVQLRDESIAEVDAEVVDHRAEQTVHAYSDAKGPAEDSDLKAAAAEAAHSTMMGDTTAVVEGVGEYDEPAIGACEDMSADVETVAAPPAETTATEPVGEPPASADAGSEMAGADQVSEPAVTVGESKDHTVEVPCRSL
jgi:hypothetical protein